MIKIHLFSIDGRTDVTGREVFCHILNAAIEALVQEKYKDSLISVPFELTPELITEAYEKMKQLDFGEYDGQKAQEFFVTSILKHYFESLDSTRKFLLAFPQDESADTVIVETDPKAQYKPVGEAALVQSPIISYPFQLKEIREQDDIFAIAARGKYAEEMNLLDTKTFRDFKTRFEKKIVGGGSYADCIPVLFLRAPMNAYFNPQEVSAVVQEMNKGYFKQIWLIAPVVGLKAQDGTVTPPQPGKFNFIVHDLLNTASDGFVVVNIECLIKRLFLKK